jgi:hypothetical protein
MTSPQVTPPPPPPPAPHIPSHPQVGQAGPARARSLRARPRIARLGVMCSFGVICAALCAPDASAITVAVTPLSTPHLNDAQTTKQTKALSAALNRLSGVKATALLGQKSPQRLLGAPRLDLLSLHRDEQRALSLCDLLRVDLLLLSEMRLGDERRPARLVTRVFQCASGAQSATELSFSGKLNDALWRDVARAADPLLESAHSPAQAGGGAYGGGAARPPVGSQGYQGRGQRYPQGAPSPTMGMPPLDAAPLEAPPQGPRSMVGPMGVTTTPLQPPLQPPLPDPSQSALPTLSIWGGTQTLNPSFTLESKPTSTALKKGIAYSSRWLFGWGGRARLAPFGGALRFLSAEGEVSHFRFNTLQVIPNLFDRDTTLNLPSEALIWAAGARFSFPLYLGGRHHWLSARVGWYRHVMSVTYNAEFNGLRTNALDIHLTGQLTLVDKRSWLELGGRMRPFIDLGPSVREIGERVSSFGFGFDLALVVRSAAGLSLRLGATVGITSHTPTGQGRSGRLAESATEQVILGSAELGWVTD